MKRTPDEEDRFIRLVVWLVVAFIFLFILILSTGARF